MMTRAAIVAGKEEKKISKESDAGNHMIEHMKSMTLQTAELTRALNMMNSDINRMWNDGLGKPDESREYVSL